MQTALKQGFPPFQDVKSLESAVESVCSRFGKVAHLQVLPAIFRPTLQCGCILTLENAATHAAVKKAFNVIEIDARLGFFADLDEKWNGPRF